MVPCKPMGLGQMADIETSGLWTCDSNYKIKADDILPGFDTSVNNAIVLSQEVIHPSDKIPSRYITNGLIFMFTDNLQCSEHLRSLQRAAICFLAVLIL